MPALTVRHHCRCSSTLVFCAAGMVTCPFDATKLIHITLLLIAPTVVYSSGGISSEGRCSWLMAIGENNNNNPNHRRTTKVWSQRQHGLASSWLTLPLMCTDRAQPAFVLEECMYQYVLAYILQPQLGGALWESIYIIT